MLPQEAARLLHADAEKRQHDLAEDVAGDRDRGGDDDERPGVGQDVADDDPEAADPERLGGGHELVAANREHEAADDARETGPSDEREDRHDAEVDLLAGEIDGEDGAQRDDQVERRDAEQQLRRRA